MYGRRDMSEEAVFVVDVEAVVHRVLDNELRHRLGESFGMFVLRDNNCGQFIVALSDSVHAADEHAARGNVSERVLALLPAGSDIVALTASVPNRTARQQHPSNGL